MGRKYSYKRLLCADMKEVHSMVITAELRRGTAPSSCKPQKGQVHRIVTVKISKYRKKNSETDELLAQMDRYIEELKKMPKEKAKKKSLEALKRTGVIGEDGNPKDTIVSWE